MAIPTPETVTIVFTDLVDSTAIRTSLGEEAADALGALHYEMLCRVVAGRRGRTVKGLGDGILAVFDAAVDAIEAAVVMQQLADRYTNSPDAVAPLHLRIGVSTGDIVWDEADDIAGSAAVEAARLEAAAAPGQILCAELTRLVARGRGGHQFSAIGELELKGLRAPVPVCEVLWEQLEVATQRIPLPEALARSPATFVGRDIELEALTASFGRDESPAVLSVLVGEPGIGKTTLAAVAAQGAHADGRVVLYGRCDNQLRVPYRPFIDAIEAWAQAVEPTAVEEVVAGDMAWLGRVSPTVAATVPAPPHNDTVPEVERLALFEAVRCWLAHVQPVLVLDDLHWATDLSVQLLGYLLRSSGIGNTRLVATVRGAEQGLTLAECISDAVSRGRAAWIPIEGLKLDDIADLGDLDAAGLLQRTGGNPLFIEALRAEGSDAESFSVEAAVARRVRGLQEPVRELLRIAAVVGLEFELTVLTAVAGVEEARALDRLDAAVSAGVIREHSANLFTFAHGLVQEAFGNELGPTRQARLHGAIAKAIEHVDPTRVGELALHYDAAGDDQKAIAYLTMSVEQSDLLAANDESIRLHTRLADLHTDEPTILHHRFRALMSNAYLGRYTRDRQAEIAQISIRSGELGLTQMQVETALEATFFTVILGHTTAAQMDLLDAIDLGAISDPILRLRGAIAIAMEEIIGFGRNDRATEMLDRIQADVDPAADAVGAAWYHHARLWSMQGADELAERIDHGRKSLELMEAGGMYRQVAATGWMLAACELMSGDHAAARHTGQRCAGAIETRNMLLHDHLMRTFDATLAHAAGEFETALNLIETNFDVSEMTEDFDTEGIYGAQKFMVLREQGRLSELAGPMQLIARLDPEQAGSWRPGLAALYADLGMTAEAQRELDAIMSRPGGPFEQDNRYLMSLSFLVDATVATNDKGHARRLLVLLEPFQDQDVSMAGITYLGPTSRYLARLATVLGDEESAEKHYRDAIKRSCRSPTPVYEARSRFGLARLHADRGRLSDALFEVGLALEIAVKLGMSTLEQDCNELRGSVTAAK